jgi:transposase
MAVGRKNWIHLGSPQAGPKVAAIVSVMETCRRRGVPVRDYLSAVLPGPGEVSIRHVAELTPAAWVLRNR